MGEGYNLNIKELVKNLRMATLKFMSPKHEWTRHLCCWGAIWHKNHRL